MDELSKKTLTELLDIAPEALTVEQIEFMKARRGYLSQAELAIYAEVMDIEKPEVKKSKPVSKKALAEFRKVLETKGLTEVEVCAQFEAEKLEALTPDQFETVVKDISEL